MSTKIIKIRIFLCVIIILLPYAIILTFLANYSLIFRLYFYDFISNNYFMLIECQSRPNAAAYLSFRGCLCPLESQSYLSLLCVKGGVNAVDGGIALPCHSVACFLRQRTAVPVQGKGDRDSGGRVVNPILSFESTTNRD